MKPADLASWLISVPDPIFWKGPLPFNKPAFNRIYAHLLQAFHAGKATAEMFVNGSLPNLSSFQRSVSREAARRRKLFSHAPQLT